MTKAKLRQCAWIVVLVALSLGRAKADDAPIPDFIIEPSMADIQAVADAIPDITYDQDWSEIWHFKSLNDEVNCLAKNIYWESRQEPEQGQIAVGLVTINRLKTQQFPDSICKIVYQQGRNRRGKIIAQFSWILKVRNKVPHNIDEWNHCLDLARELLGNGLDGVHDFTNGSTQYHATYVHPKWRFDYEKVTQIGLHIFYSDPDLVKVIMQY